MRERESRCVHVFVIDNTDVRATGQKFRYGSRVPPREVLANVRAVHPKPSAWEA